MTTSTRTALGGAAVAAGATGVAAKALLDRRRGRSRTYRLQGDEEVAEGIRRIAAGRAESATDHLRGEHEEEFAVAIHEARKDLKKLRSVLRLVRAPLGDAVYQRENARFRDAGRMLSGTRDAEVKQETLAALERRFGDAFPASRLTPLTEAVEDERRALADRAASENGGGAVAAAIHEIEAGRDAIPDWQLDGDGFELIADGLGRGYRRGRNRFADARQDPSAEHVHEWRKRVKDLWYHLRIVRDAKPKKLGKAADRAHQLSDLLGDHHDLTVLREDAIGRTGLIDREVLVELAQLVERRQVELVEEAMPLARKLYAEKPKPFVARVARYWTTWG